MRDAGFTPRIAATVDDQLTLHHLVTHRGGPSCKPSATRPGRTPP
ncbi:hypothetical protein [Streptomyces sp. NPDC054940]